MSTRDTQSAARAQRPRPLTRLAALLSLRTISGKLIMGLIVLFGLASIIVSVVTAESLSNSLMSSLNPSSRPRPCAGRTARSRRKVAIPTPTQTRTRR